MSVKFADWRDKNRYIGTKTYKVFANNKIINLCEKATTGCSLVAAIAIGIVLDPKNFQVWEYSGTFSREEITQLTYGGKKLPYQLVPMAGSKFIRTVPRSEYGGYLETLRAEIEYITFGGKS